MRQARWCARVAGPVRLAAALVVVLGIFGMHALTHHGTSHPPAPEGVGAASAHATHDMGGTAQSAAPTLVAQDVTGIGIGSGSGFGSGPKQVLGDMVMLCVVILVVAGTMLGLLTSIRRRPRLWAFLPSAVGTVRPLRWLERVDSGPPHVWQFSVIRC